MTGKQDTFKLLTWEGLPVITILVDWRAIPRARAVARSEVIQVY